MRLSFFTLKRRAIATVLAVVFLLSFAMPVSAAFSTDPAYVVGWAWNSVMGWVKMRGDVLTPDPNNVGQFIRTGTYGVTVTKDSSGNDGIISGWTWSSVYGWICWGKTCDANDVAQYPNGELDVYTNDPNLIPSGGWDARVIDLYNPTHSSPSVTTYTVNGWAKILSLGDNGWISLSGSAGAGTYGMIFNSDIREFRGWAWNGVSSGFSVGWIAFSGATINDTPGACGTPAECAVSYAAGQSVWATQIIDKWIETKGGNIYSQLGFNISPEPPIINNKFNADYLIHSATEVDPSWKAACTSSTATGADLPLCDTIGNPDEAFDSIVLPKKENSYQGTAGLINTTALTDTVLVDGVHNAHGVEIITMDAQGSELLGVMNGEPLNNRVFFRDGDLTIDYTDPDIRRFINATLDGESGAGTVVVKGNIIFKDPITYESAATVDSVKKLASVAWIALKRDDNTGGNITIDNCMDPAPRDSSEPAVLVGTFVAENIIQTGTGQGGTNAGECPNLKVVTTVTAGTPPVTTTNTEYVNIPLHVYGTMIARQFNFQRKQVDYERGSELIDYDGRLTVNTPPGLDDFAKSMPTWRQVGF